MKITVFGTGYVGLVQGTILANVGHHVTCVDIDSQKIENLKQGILPIFEPGLEPLVKDNYAKGLLHFTTNAVEAIEQSSIFFIAVGTPPDEDGSADLQYVLSVAETIASHINQDCIIIDKSTVPVGTADKVATQVKQVLTTRNKLNIKVNIASNPEFLKEGSAVNDCMKPDRIIIGTNDAATEQTLRELYAPFNRNHEKIIVMDIRSAELCKYAANCLLATKISFMNEMANLAEQLGADIQMVRQGIGSDPRIGYHFIYAGAGYGGSCFPKDVKALIRTAKEIGFEAKVLNAVEERNDLQKHVLFTKINKHFSGNLEGKTFALWGLSFKPNTDDMREAPSRVLMEALWQAGAKVKAYDPKAMDETKRIYGKRDDLQLCQQKEDTLKGSDALIIITEWQEFKAPDFNLICSNLKNPVIFDGRNLFSLEQMKELKITYYSIGRQAQFT